MKLTEFKTRTEASAAAADFLAEHLRLRLAVADLMKTEPAPPGRVAFMVSGGSTPQECLAILAGKPLPWGRISVMPTDERCVPEDHEASNAGMIRRQLGQGPARGARLVPMSEAAQRPIPGQLCCCLIGMGEDGHFASIFPDNPALESLLALGGGPQVVKVKTAASPYARETANLALILQSAALLLLAFGETKKSVLLQPGQTPIAALLSQRSSKLHVYWAP